MAQIESFHNAGDKVGPKIDEVTSLSLSDFRRRYLRTGRPVIVRHGASDWAAVQTWTIDKLKELFGSHPVNARFLPHGVSSAIEGESRADKPRSLTQFIEVMRKPPADGLWYLVQQPIDDLPAAMLADLGILSYRSGATQALTGHKPYFWMGSKGSKTGLHYDLLHNFNIQLFGRKAWRLYPPSQRDLLYFGEGEYPHHSSTNIFSVDNSRYPLIARARPIEFELGPGDVLFFPAGWPHCVETLDESMSLNLFTLWLRPSDIGIVLREAPIWIYKKLLFKSRKLLQKDSQG